MQPSKAEIKMMIMKKNIIHATLAAAMMILVASCSKNEVIAPDDVRRDGISFSASGADTRALINRADLLTDGSKVKVHDDLFGFTGKLDGVQKNAGDVTAYIDDAIVYGNGGWSYETTDAYYPWTKTGTHKFFGWLTYDAKSNLNLTDLPFAPELKGDTLKVPSVSMTHDKSQFDFLYSESIFRDAAKDDRGAINLHLKHLFTAVGFKFVNRSSSDQISIKSVVFKMPHTANARILFLASNPDPEIIRENDSLDYFTATYSTPIVLDNAAAVSADPTRHSQYNPVEKTYTDDNEFFLLWPASASEIAPQNPDGTQTNELVEIVYSINGGDDITAKLNFSSIDLTPGSKHLLNFQFINKQVLLGVRSIPWDYVEGNISFYDAAVSGRAINLANVTQSEDNPSYKIIDKATPATGTFNVMTPVGGRLTVGTSGDTEYFKVSLDHNDINSSNTQFTVTIAPVTTIGGSGTKRIQLHFTVEAPNGRSISADSVIDPDKYQYVFEL